MTRPADLQFTPDSIEAMLGELEEHYEAEDLNLWETDFYRSIRGAMDEGGTVTRKQFDKLVELYKAYCE